MRSRTEASPARRKRLDGPGIDGGERMDDTVHGLALVRPDLESRLTDDHHDALRLWLRLLACTTMVERGIRRRLRERFGMTLARFDLMAQLERFPAGLLDGRPVEAADGDRGQRHRSRRPARGRHLVAPLDHGGGLPSLYHPRLSLRRHLHDGHDSPLCLSHCFEFRLRCNLVRRDDVPVDRDRMVTPPVGMNLFMTQAVAGEGTTIGQIFRGSFPFLVCCMIVLAIITIYPRVVTWLPAVISR